MKKMFSLNYTTKNNFYDNQFKINNNKTIRKNRSSTYIGENNYFNNKGEKTNKNMVKPLNGNTLYNYRASFSPSQNILNKNKRLPLLIFDKSKKYSFNSLERLKNYAKMRKYRIKLKKTQKVENTEDKLFKFLHENGLHYSFSSNKYYIGDKFNYYSKYIPDRFKINFNSLNDNADNNDIQDENGNEYSDKTKRKDEKNNLYYSTTDEDDDDRMSFQKYMKLQSVADVRFRPRLGESSNDLINYIRKIENIRKGVVNDLIAQINNVENRYNKEYPKEDSKFTTKMQGLYHHKWKNAFSLRDYQNLFTGNLRGRISSKNYEIMTRNFKDIFLMCFAADNINYNKIKPFQI
jgi:hypothetical protein